jgi:hypothetical protein
VITESLYTSHSFDIQEIKCSCTFVCILYILYILFILYIFIVRTRLNLWLFPWIQSTDYLVRFRALMTLFYVKRDWLIDWLIDLHWVWSLTVPMHLGLIDEPFVPHNMISAQESPVPLPKSQMAPRLKILMSSGSKKGTQICYPLPSKSPGKRLPPRFPSGAPMETDARIQNLS